MTLSHKLPQPFDVDQHDQYNDGMALAGNPEWNVDIESGQTSPTISEKSALIPPYRKPLPDVIPSKGKLLVLGVDMSRFPVPMQFTFLSAGVCSFFLLCGSLEEYMFRNLKGFNFGWYMTVWELLGFAALASLEMKLQSSAPVFAYKAPLSSHALYAISMSLARGLTNMSLQFLNYPTQVIFKSLKLIAVLIGSVLMNSKQYRVSEYIAAVLLVSSAMLFSVGDAEVSPRFSLQGVFVVTLSLFFDAVHSNTQERVLQQHNAPMLELMLFGNLFGAFAALVIVLGTGEFAEAWKYCLDHPIVYLYFFIRLLVVYAGVLCFVAIIKRFGVVVATTVTTVRKVASVILSFFFFPKPFHPLHGVAGIIFVGGAWLNISAKKRASLANDHKDN